MPVCRILLSAKDWAPLRPAWEALYAQRDESLAPHPALFFAFAESLAQPCGWSPFLVAAFEGEELCGILPLATLRSKGVRILRGAANGVYFGAKALAKDPACVALLWEAALSSGLFDLFWVENVPQEVPDAAFLNARFTPWKRDPTFVSDLALPSREAWLAARSKRNRSDFLRYRRNFEKVGPVAYRVYRDEPVPPEALAAFLERKRAWCLERNEKSYLPLPETDVFLKRLTDGFYACGALHFSVLTCDEKQVAWNLCLASGKNLTCLMMAHDPAFNAHSPGSLIWMETAFWGLEHGFASYDMMHHASVQKDKFASRHGEVATYRAPVTFKGRVLDLLLKARGK